MSGREAELERLRAERAELEELAGRVERLEEGVARLRAKEGPCPSRE